MYTNRHNRRSVPTLVISALAVVAAAITWLSFKPVPAPAPPAAHPNATPRGEQAAALGAHPGPTTYTQQVAIGVTNLAPLRPFH
jgi:hypothetical protein